MNVEIHNLVTQYLVTRPVIFKTQNITEEQNCKFQKTQHGDVSEHRKQNFKGEGFLWTKIHQQDNNTMSHICASVKISNDALFKILEYADLQTAVRMSNTCRFLKNMFVQYIPFNREVLQQLLHYCSVKSSSTSFDDGVCTRMIQALKSLAYEKKLLQIADVLFTEVVTMSKTKPIQPNHFNLEEIRKVLKVSFVEDVVKRNDFASFNVLMQRIVSMSNPDVYQLDLKTWLSSWLETREHDHFVRLLLANLCDEQRHFDLPTTVALVAAKARRYDWFEEYACKIQNWSQEVFSILARLNDLKIAQYVVEVVRKEAAIHKPKGIVQPQYESRLLCNAVWFFVPGVNEEILRYTFLELSNTLDMHWLFEKIVSVVRALFGSNTKPHENAWCKCMFDLLCEIDASDRPYNYAKGYAILIDVAVSFCQFDLAIQATKAAVNCANVSGYKHFTFDIFHLNFPSLHMSYSKHEVSMLYKASITKYGKSIFNITEDSMLLYETDDDE